MQRKNRVMLLTFFVVLSGLLAFPSFARAQGRVNDKDMEVYLRNLKDDAKSFQPVFNEAVKRSLIRKTSREKDARDLVGGFVRQTDDALNTFRHRKRTDQTVPAMLSTAAQINRLVYDLNLDRRDTDRWEKIRAELHQVALAAGVPDPIQ
jgi:uncharacterized protein YdbL (DUF1318 family)